MGKHVYTLSLRMHMESSEIKNGESGTSLTVSPETLYNAVTNLRSDTLADMDGLNSREFDEALAKASEINAILAKLEELGAVEYHTEEDDEDEEEESEKY